MECIFVIQELEGRDVVGCYNTGEFLRVRDGGEITHRIETPGRAAIAPALGDDDRRTLYLVVNAEGEKVLEDTGADGRIEMTRVDVLGVDAP